MYKIAICMNLHYERADIKKMISKYMDIHSVQYFINEYECGDHLISEYEELAAFDIIIIDTFMNGINTAEKIRKYDMNACIVFVSDTAEYAVEGYEVNASAYLVKPIDITKLESALNKVLTNYRPGRLEIKSGHKYRYLAYYDIIYCESHGRTVLIHTCDNTETKVYESLDSIAERLEDKRFLRCHKSYIVNMDFITAVNNDFTLLDFVQIPIRVRSRKSITEDYHKYLISKRSNALRYNIRLKSKFISI